MRTILMLGLATLLAGAAQAADTPAEKPATGPAPAWVKQVALPPVPAAAGDAPFRVLLQDQQMLLEPDRQTRYWELAIRIQTPQGLSEGNISFPWRPDKDVLTVHKLLIRRGDQVIDVLASGQTFTVVRRETNLDSAMLDGVLTANIQPEGLQVGDVLDFAVSVATSDPVLKGHAEALAPLLDAVPVAHEHMRMQWPSALPLKLRENGVLPVLKPVRSGATTSVELSFDNVEPVEAPKGAPPRFRWGRQIEASDFTAWSSLAALMVPLYDKAAVLGPQSPLLAELARIKALSPDPKIRAEAALALVQDRVRYVALAMGAGGLVPADADTTWSRRFGDCKGKTALLLALLHALDVQAEPVLVNSSGGDGMDHRLPMVGLFDHVLVRATIAGRAYWLDGTRTGDRHLDSIQVPAFGWGLPVLAGGAALVRIMPGPLDRPGHELTIRIDATAGLDVPAPTRIEAVYRGDEAQGMNLGLANLAGDARDRALKDYWKQRYDFITPRSVTATFDPATGEEHLTLLGDAKMDWNYNRYETDGTGVGYKADFSRDPGPDRDAPFAVAFPFYYRVVETILLPQQGRGFRPGDNVEINQTAAGIDYRRHATIAGNVFTIEETERSLAPEFAAADAPAAQAALAALAAKTAYVMKPADYRPTEKEVAAAMAATPSDATGFVARGNLLMNQHRLDEAIADFGRALALDPKDAWALADRGVARAWKGDAAAAADLDAAAAIDPRNAVVFRGRGMVAEQKGASADAIAAFTRSLDIEPDNSFALGHRAEAYRAVGDDAHALADAAAAIKLEPAWTDLYLMRADVLRGSGRQELVLAEAAALAAANPDNAFAHVAAARIYGSIHHQAEAMHEFDRAIAIKPEAYIYVNRSAVRPKEDFAGRSADIEAALHLDPKSADAIAARAKLKEDGGDHDGALATWTAAVAASPGDPQPLIGRGIFYARAGQTALADKDFAAARAKINDPTLLNNMCWAKATAGVALQSALADCDAALAKGPDVAGFMDSKALVLLRLGRTDEAIAEYDRALARRPNQAASLFGRALAWAKKGDKAKADADAAAAARANADVRTEFEGYGLTI